MTGSSLTVKMSKSRDQQFAQHILTHVEALSSASEQSGRALETSQNS